MRITACISYFARGLALFPVSLALHAAPQIVSVAGEADHSRQLTISGAEFGVRSDYNSSGNEWRGNRFLPFRVKDFDDGSLSSGGFNNPGSSWMLRPGGRHSTGSFATKYYNGQRLGALSASQRGTTGTWYISYWFMMPAGTSSSKPFRMYGSGTAQNLYLATGGSQGFSLRGYSECSAAECSSDTIWSSPQSFIGGRWHRVEIILSQANGRITTYIDGKEQWSRDRWLASTPGAYDGHTIDLGNMINAHETGGSNAPENNSYNFDDVYIDYTLARVEIGDAPTWVASSKRELQVPIKWTNNSITIAVNSGTFTKGTRAYLYVVDANGVVNASGYPITIGDPIAGSSPRLPKAPQLEVQ